MREPISISTREVAGMIQDHSTLYIIRMTSISASETVLEAVEQKFLDADTPHGLILFHTYGQPDRKGGIAHLAHEGLMTKVVGGHWDLYPPFTEVISEGRLEAYNPPQRQVANMFHNMALHEPGKLNRIGLGTFVDPRIEGGKMNSRTMDKKDTAAVVTVDEEEYMQYREIPVNTPVTRGTYADEAGNISTGEETMVLEVLPAAMAAKRFGGKVIHQVKQVVRTGTLDPEQVTVPGVMADAAMICENLMKEHRQISSWYFDPPYSSQAHTSLRAPSSIPFNIRKIAGRRAATLLKNDVIINVGIGIPNDVIGPMLAEEDVQDDAILTAESGVYGGVPAGGVDFDISCSPQALISHDQQFECHTGAGIDYTFMGVGEMDAQRNINATKVRAVATGAGGFIDITGTAESVVFCSTSADSQVKVEFDGCRIKIFQEGRFRKLVKKAQQVSYNGRMAVSKGQNMLYVTERAVFRLTEDGPMLVEIARGVDLEQDMLTDMELCPLVAEHIKETPIRIYREGPFSLKNIVKGWQVLVMEHMKLHHTEIVMDSQEGVDWSMKKFGLEEDYTEYVKPYKSNCLFTKHREDEMSIELVTPSEGVLATYNNGRGGMHHIVFEVEDAGEVGKKHEAEGMKLLEESAASGAEGVIVNFLRPRFEEGVLAEFVQKLEK